jgi:glycosyltransferase involved in cell wall biosynthesis
MLSSHVSRDTLAHTMKNTLVDRDESPLPSVSVVLVVRDEIAYIQRSLGAVLAQDYPVDLLEVIVVDGMSTDGTRDILKVWSQEHSNLTVLDNPRAIVSSGMNVAITQARGEIIVWVSGHCEYPPDYVRRVVQLRHYTGADNAGGVLVPIGESYVQRAIAAASYSPVSVGGAMKGHSSSAPTREVDAVHGGCWKRSRLLAVGMFDEEMVRNQDDELSFRLRKSGGTIIQSPAIQIRYHVRNSYRKLFMQFAQYGYWKVKVITKHPKQASIRHIVPAFFAGSILGLASLSGFSSSARLILIVECNIYVAVIAGAAIIEANRAGWYLWPGIATALATMHISYGWGFLVGLLRAVVGPLPSDHIFEAITR